MSIVRRISNLFSRSKVDREIGDELRAHIEMRVEDNIAAGMAPEEARRNAVLRFGNPAVMKEKVAGMDAALGFEGIVRDLRYAFRQLRKSPGLSVTVIVTLALGIGVNAAIFSIVDAVLLRPLPYRDANRLVVVWQTDAAHRGTGAWFDPYRDFEEWQRGSRSFERLAAFSWAASGSTLLWHEKPIGMLALPTGVDFFSMLGVRAALGRTFSHADLDNGCTLVLSYPFWREKLGASDNILGQSVTVDRTSCVVVGVMPQNFSFYPKQTNAWSLITPTSEFVKKPWDSMTGVFALLKPGVTRAQAEAELNAIEKRVSPEAPASLAGLAAAQPIVLDLKDNFTWLAGRNLRAGLWVLSAAVGLILLMACLNVANLLLGRAMVRSREMAVRAALGAGRARLVRQLLTESLLLALAGTGAGLLLALLSLRWFRSVNPVELPPGNVVSLDWQVLLFAVGLGVCSAMVFGLFPAWRAAQVDLNSTLKLGERGAGAHASAHRASQTLIVMQIALSLMLFVGAGLLVSSLWRMATTQLGYRTEHVLTAMVNLPQEHYADADARSKFAAGFAEKIAALPGVVAVTEASSFTPYSESPLSIEGDVSPSGYSAGGIATQNVSGNFFDAMRIPLLQGRDFDTRDQKNTQQVAIINQALAGKYFPHTDPIGRAIKLSRADDQSLPWLTIVGVAATIKTTTVFQEMGYVEQPAVYRPLTQNPPASLALMVVTQGSPLDLVGGIEGKLALMDRGLVLVSVGTMQDQQSAVLSQPRFRTVLLGSFALLALLLAVIGLYGVLAQMVAQRTRQTAIRMALGATRRNVLGSVFREAFILAALGIALGIVGSTVAVHALARLLYGVRPENAMMFALASIVLMLTAFLASWLPARRAASVDPMQALRSE